MSPVQIMPTVCSNEDRPIRVSRSLVAIPGSSSADWIALCNACHAPTGSSPTDGIG
jgi:cytochrome c553